MNSKFASLAKHYLLGLLASSWNGGIGAVSGILGIDAVAMTGATTEARILNWHEMLAAFGGAFVLHAFMWLKKNPLPETYNDTNPPTP
jgi:hypothetical protein